MDLEEDSYLEEDIGLLPTKLTDIIEEDYDGHEHYRFQSTSVDGTLLQANMDL